MLGFGDVETFIIGIFHVPSTQPTFCCAISEQEIAGSTRYFYVVGKVPVKSEFIASLVLRPKKQRAVVILPRNLVAIKVLDLRRHIPL